MTFDEFKEFTKAAIELAGDAAPDIRAAIVIAAINKHVLMPSDLEEIQKVRGWAAGAVPVGRGAALGVATRGDQLVPGLG